MHFGVRFRAVMPFRAAELCRGLALQGLELRLVNKLPNSHDVGSPGWLNREG